jgi:cytochrome c biogenesis protein CcdA
MIKKKPLILIACVIFSFLFPALAEDEGEPARLLVFQSAACNSCIAARTGILPEIEKEYKGRVVVEYYDLADINNYKLLIGLREKYGSNIDLSLPVFFMRGNFLNGRSDLKSTLGIFVEGNLAEPADKLNGAGVDLVERFKGIKPLVILGSGLIDGINPCAFTVIVFFMSYLALQGYRKKGLIAIGASFVGVVFLTYTLIGLGVFNFFYRLQVFWFFAKAFNLGVGIMSILLGVFALYDFFKFRKTKDPQGLILQLPDSIKKRIHSVIGLYYRRNPQEKPGVAGRPLLRLILSALVTGFLVSLLEAVCTGQLYLPTIAFVLKTTPLKLQALWYLLIYNVMFILPLIIIFVMALSGVASERFSACLKRHLSAVKISMAFVFFGLGIFLLWKG